MTAVAAKPIVLVTGAAGNLGRSVAAALASDYRIVGLDQKAQDVGFPVLEVDLKSDTSVEIALHKVRNNFGSSLASVVHLAAYFHFSGEDNPLYQSVNVDGTRRLLQALQGFEVAQFRYVSTNLALAGLIGLWLLFTRVTMGAEGELANAHHVIGCLVLTVVSVAVADVARPARALNALLGVVLMFVPSVFDGDRIAVAVGIGLGLALVLLSIRRGPIEARCGRWNRLLV